MWNDVKTTQDLLNFKVVADTAAQMIKEGNGEPVSIGVSGSWGIGKSSLVQMIGESLKSLDGGENYIFIDFNAWLYQGYDDARKAPLHNYINLREPCEGWYNSQQDYSWEVV